MVYGGNDRHFNQRSVVAEWIVILMEQKPIRTCFAENISPVAPKLWHVLSTD